MAASAAAPSADVARAPSAGSWTRRSREPAAPPARAARADSTAPKSPHRADSAFDKRRLVRGVKKSPCPDKYFAQDLEYCQICAPAAHSVRDAHMQGDARVIEYLNRGLRHELSAINQYWLHYRLLDNWGYRALAKKWRKESIEEMEHGDKLVERIIFLDGFPNMQVLDPLHIGQNVREVLDCDLALEMAARALYQEAATHCHAVKDYVSRDLFEKLMHDEEEHIDFLETQLDLVSKLGLELYAQHHIGKLDDDHDS